VQCGEETASTFTYCGNCGSINCESHIETERLEGTPVCTGCAVTGRFMLSTKYFYDQDNRDQFRAEYEQMPLQEKLMENVPLAAGVVLGLVATVLFVLVSVGIL
jgi:restriction endonuclease Mrr